MPLINISSNGHRGQDAKLEAIEGDWFSPGEAEGILNKELIFNLI